MDVANDDISSSAVSRRGKYTTMIKNALYSLSQSFVTKEQFARDIGELANELRQASDCNRVFSTFLDNLILCQDEWAGIDHNFLFVYNCLFCNKCVMCTTIFLQSSIFLFDFIGLLQVMLFPAVFTLMSVLRVASKENILLLSTIK